jgi:hypothetical protein
MYFSRLNLTLVDFIMSVAYFLPVPKIFIPYPESSVEKDPRSGSASINFKYFNPKTCYLSSRKYDPRCSSRIQFFFNYPGSIPDPGVKKHRIQDADPQHRFLLGNFLLSFLSFSSLSRFYIRYGTWSDPVLHINHADPHHLERSFCASFFILNREILPLPEVKGGKSGY